MPGRAKSSSRSRSSSTHRGSSPRPARSPSSFSRSSGSGSSSGSSLFRRRTLGTSGSRGALPAFVYLLLGGAFILLLVFIWWVNSRDAAPTTAAGLPAEVSVGTAYTMQQDGAFLLDVREQSEWDEFHAAGATLIPLGQLASRTAELPTDKDIVVICRSGNRSAEARDLLLEAGFTNVTSVAGGMNEWRTMKLPLGE